MMLDGVQISGLKWVRCRSCPKRFAVLIESSRTECLACEAARKSSNRRAKESKRWHISKAKEAQRGPSVGA